MKFSQFTENNELSFHSPITQEEWDRITDTELENTETITFKTPSGKEVPFRKVKHGEWNLYEINEDHEYEWFCSECDKSNDIKTNFCPNCGANMRGKTE